MKIKVISALFILVCFGIMISGCSSPSTSSQGNYPQQSNQVNYPQQSNQVNSQSSSNVDPIVGCWIYSRNAGAGITATDNFEFDSSGGGYMQNTVGSAKLGTQTKRYSISWGKLPNSEYGYGVNVVNPNAYYIFQYSPSAGTLIQQIQKGSPLVFSKTNC